LETIEIGMLDFFLEFVHPDDVEKVREQLNLQPQDGSPNSSVTGRVLDLKTGTVKKDGHASSARLGKFG
jgi:aryl hydrocarbon receptor nuclear translocator